MLGISFKNPNYDCNVNGKVQLVDNELELLSTDKDYCVIKYSGFKFGNAVITIGSYRIKENATALLPTEELCRVNSLFRKGELETYEFKGKLFNKNDEFLFDITKTQRGFQVGVTNAGPSIAMSFSNERFKYLMDRLMLGYVQFLAAEQVTKGRLKEIDQKNHDTYKLGVIEMLGMGVYPQQYPYNEPKRVFKTTDSDNRSLSLDMNSYGIHKIRLAFECEGKEIMGYLSFEDALLISQDIKSEKYFKLFGKTNKPLFEKIGGTKPSDTKKPREDGLPEARIFTIESGTTPDTIVFKLQIGIGNETKNGGLTMKAVEQVVSCTLNKKAANSFACRVNKSILAYLISEFDKEVQLDPLAQKLGQITRVNAAKTFVAPVSRAFNMKKIRFDFAEYDKNATTSKQTQYIDFYFTEENFFTLYEQVLNGTIMKAVNAENARIKASGEKWAKPVKEFTAGTAPESAGRADGMALAKTFALLPGTSSAFAMRAISGAGIQDEDKKIKIKKQEKRVLVSLDGDSLKKLVLITGVYWKAYKIAQNIALEKEQLKIDQNK